MRSASAAAVLGQDNDEVYTELGLDKVELARLREQGVV